MFRKSHKNVPGNPQEEIARSPSFTSLLLAARKRSERQSTNKSSLPFHHSKQKALNGDVTSNGSVVSVNNNGQIINARTHTTSVVSHNREVEDFGRQLYAPPAYNEVPRDIGHATVQPPAAHASPSSATDSVPMYLRSHQILSPPSSIARCKIVIGIDFGTTFSGVAYALVHPNENTEDVRINTVCDWEGRLPGRTTSNKVPTEIAFDEDDGGKPYWGFDIPDHLSSKKIKYVKLLLEPDVSRRVSSMNDIVNPEGTKALLDRQGRSAVEVAGLFVKLLWEHARAQIIRHKGKASWDYSEKIVLFTVPAVWSERAKHNTYMVAVEAGLVATNISLHMVSEPEAAAVAVLKDRAMAGRLIEGEVFVIVDAGGGTVDLTSYRIVTVEPLKLEEVVSGDGDVCGATFLENRFQQLLRNRIGDVQLQKLSPLIKERIICDWEDSIRATFIDEDKEYHLIMPGILDDEVNGIESGLMTLSAENLRPIFSPTIKSIQQLVQKQLTSLARQSVRPAGIILVGGLGSNRYLAQQLKQQYQSDDSGCEPSIEIQQPDIAWESVAHGAVRCEVLGYGSIVSLRVARWNIGYSRMNEWGDGSGFHPEQKCYNECTGKYMAKYCVVWLIRRGQKLAQNASFEEDFIFHHWDSEIDEALLRKDESIWSTLTFVASQEDDASNNASAHTRSFMSVRLKLDFSRFPVSLMPQKYSPDGRPYRSAPWHFCAKQDMAGMKVSVSIFDQLVEDDIKVDFYSLPDRIDEGKAYTITRE